MACVFGGGIAHLLLLSNPVSPGLSLQVVLRVPVRVEDDHGVSRGQVNAQASGPRGQQEAEVLFARGEKRKTDGKPMRSSPTTDTVRCPKQSELGA